MLDCYATILGVFITAIRMNGHHKPGPHVRHFDNGSSILSSDLDTTSFCDSDEDSR